jgi:archaellum component FlaC
MNRLQILAKIDDLHERHCKGCKHFDSNYAENVHQCKKCEIREKLQGLGRRLESTKKERKPLGETKPVLDIDTYQTLSAQGKTDSDIAKEYGISQPTISYYKKKWFKEGKKATLSVVEKKKQPEPTKTIRREKESELQALVNELSDKLRSKEGTIKQLENKVAELEHLNAACDDVEEETNVLQKQLDHFREMNAETNRKYLTTFNQLEKTDAELENHKQWLKTAGEELNRLQKENKHLWALIGLKAAEFNG